MAAECCCNQENCKAKYLIHVYSQFSAVRKSKATSCYVSVLSTSYHTAWCMSAYFISLIPLNSSKHCTWLTGNECTHRAQLLMLYSLWAQKSVKNQEWMTFKGLLKTEILMVDLKTVWKWKSPRSSSSFAS